MSYRKKHIGPKIRGLRPKKRFFKKRWFWIFLSLLIIIAGVFYVVLFLPAFQVKELAVSGNNKVPLQDIETLAWKSISKKMAGISYASIFMVSGQALKSDILANFPGIQDVKIQKKWFQGISLEVTERVPVAIFCQEKCFLMDGQGIIFEPADGLPKNMMIIRGGQNGSQFLLGENAVDKNSMEAVFKIQKNLKSNADVDVKEVVVSNPLVVTTSENWKIYFDPTGDIDLQITKMDLLLKDQIPAATRKNLQYIYLQYKDRAYYK